MNKKIVAALVLGLVHMNLAFAAESKIPSNEVFTQIRQAGEKAGFSGYDLTACIDENSTLVLGGVSSWNGALQVVIADKTGNLIATAPITRDPLATTIEYQVGSQTSSLSGLESMKPLKGDSMMMTYVGTIDGNTKVDCYLRLSSLE